MKIQSECPTVLVFIFIFQPFSLLLWETGKLITCNLGKLAKINLG